AVQQHEPMTGDGQAGQIPVSGGEQVAESVQVHPPTPQFEKGSHHVSDHVVQESCGFCGVELSVAYFLEVGTIDPADRVLDCAAGKCRQTGEVMTAFE